MLALLDNIPDDELPDRVLITTPDTGLYMFGFGDEAGDFVFETHRKPWIVDEVQHRDMKQIAEIEVPLQFVAAIGGERAAVDMPAVGGDDAERITAESHKARDLIGTPEGADLKE